MMKSITTTYATTKDAAPAITEDTAYTITDDTAYTITEDTAYTLTEKGAYIVHTMQALGLPELEPPDTVLPEAEEPDPLPEYCHYHDEGCELAPSCLNCPFERCVYDEPGGVRHFLKEDRDAKMISLYRRGMGTAELARIFNISRRSVQRIVKGVGGG